MKVFGQVTLKEDRLIIDAEPHVMQRIRPLFDRAQNLFERGKYTHNPMGVTMTRSTAKDILWVHSRYNLAIDPAIMARLQSSSKEYDDIVHSIDDASNDGKFKISPEALQLALPLREHQVKFLNMIRKTKRMLLADRIALGKTASALSVILEPECRPAIVVTPAHLCSHWEAQIKKFLPTATYHTIPGFKKYPIPKVDVIITSYNRLQPWQDILMSDENHFKTVILEEVHELRHVGTGKREIAKMLSENAQYCVGLSGTPIYNYGSEIYNVMDAIAPGALGDHEEFLKEWCSWDRVVEPSTLHSFLKSMGLFLRRSAEDAGLKLGDITKIPIALDADLNELEKVQNVAKLLALSVLSGRVGESSDAERELDWKLRHATGVAKARPVAELVKMIVGEGEKVILVGWHRDVYDIWMKELAAFNPVMYTGSETIKEKDASIKKFIEGQAKVFIISLRSGAGIDGLQAVCSKIVLGELDWSPHVMDQVIGRLDRPGQTQPIQAFFPTIADGSDPFMMRVLGIKRSQHDGLVEGKKGETEILSDTGDKSRVREMAKAYLESIGEEIPVVVEEKGLVADVASILRRIRVPTNTEEEMQEALYPTLKEMLKDATVEREYKLSKRSRLDFLITRNDERVAIECKKDSTKRAEVYRQVRRYVEEVKVTAVVLYAPWEGIGSFVIDGTPVIVVDTSTNAL